MPEFDIQILYSQFSVHTAEAPDFPHWTDEHVEQGVAWRIGHASFGIPDHDGTCLLDIDRTDAPLSVGPQTERLIAVPFDLPLDTDAFVATILETMALDMPAGAYQLWFELRREPELIAKGQAYRIVLRFQPSPTADFLILRQGAEMTSPTINLRDADPEL